MPSQQCKRKGLCLQNITHCFPVLKSCIAEHYDAYNLVKKCYDPIHMHLLRHWLMSADTPFLEISKQNTSFFHKKQRVPCTLFVQKFAWVVNSSLCLQISEAQKDVGSNHAVSGLKFKILSHFLQLGYAVLLSDVDIVTLQNPFQHLYRDSDVEAMSDGWNNATAYGTIPSYKQKALQSSISCAGNSLPFHIIVSCAAKRAVLGAQ